MELNVEGMLVATTDEGFLIDLNDWSETVALELARQHDMSLNAMHWEVLFFIRQYYQNYQHLPNSRGFVKAIKNTLGEDKGSSRYLQKLFPLGPLKYACKLAGLPKPPTCL